MGVAYRLDVNSGTWEINDLGTILVMMNIEVNSLISLIFLLKQVSEKF